ncbi:MAG: hypothetical protein LBQ50_13240 [Planctomycetaceae bacterium]|jgi:hypothetical protein|nr:hypothetical protein [Planctomycetaceae bacterium]
MEHDEEELRLAPIEDDELGLAPIKDEEAEKPIAPEIPYNAGVRLIPVICSACKTRLYAGEDQVGLWKRCPDCDRLTEIRAVPARFMLIANDPEAAGGYKIQEPEISGQDIFQLKAENQKSIDEYRKKQNQNRMENRLPPPVFIDRPPMLDGVLNQFLKSSEEKEEESEIIHRESEIEREVEAVKRAVRNGKLEEYLAQSESRSPTPNEPPPDPAARKRIEKQRQFDAAVSLPTPPPLPPVLTVHSPPLPPKAPPSFSEIPSSFSETSQPISKLPQHLSENSFHSSNSPKSPKSPDSSGSLNLSKLPDLSTVSGEVSDSFWWLFLERRCRARMLILIFCGFLGNLTGEKARSMIWQILIDRVYGQPSGYSYNLTESGFFLINFWFGAVLSLVWLTLLFLFGISLFLETAAGKDRIENWIPFNLDFGLSYVGWTLLLLFVSGFPGFILWQGTAFFLPDKESALIFLHFTGQFLCFPVLFLCAIESDTFYGNFPRQTLSSLWQRPGLWLWFYVVSAVLVGVPAAILSGLFFAGTALAEHWIMQSLFYYLIAAILLTFCGFFVLFYFRLLGKTAWKIRSKYPNRK